MKKSYNYYLLFSVFFLLASSLIFLACLSGQASWEKFHNTHYYLYHQIIFGIIPALILGLIAFKVPLDFLKKYSMWIFLANLLALFLVFLPKIGSHAYGASRWINLGFASFQPSEFLKVSAILYLSAWSASKLDFSISAGRKQMSKYHNIIHVFAPFIVFLGLIAIALFFQRDVSTLGIISITLLTLYFSARTHLWHSALIVTLGLGILFCLIYFEPYRFDRWLIFLHPNIDPLGKGRQVTQSIISLGSGGFFGKGLGLSTEKFGYLPQAMSDSIFAIIGEELGFIGCFILIIAFLIFLWIGIQISKQSNDRFSKMTAVGIITWITLQAFINMSSAAGIFPLAGIPLPFFSYGGSHLIVEMIGVGLLLNISKKT